MGHWIGKEIFEENDYRNPADFAVMIYIILNRDMAGVCPVNEKRVAAACRIRPTTARKSIDYFAKKGKLFISKDRSHVWWKSGIFYTLNQGHFSKKQYESCINLVRKWYESCNFLEKSVKSLSQLYATKYNLPIPIPNPTPTHYTESDTILDSYTTRYKNPSTKYGTKGISDSLRNPKIPLPEQTSSRKPKKKEVKKRYRKGYDEIMPPEGTEPPIAPPPGIPALIPFVDDDYADDPAQKYFPGVKDAMVYIRGVFQGTAEEYFTKEKSRI